MYDTHRTRRASVEPDHVQIDYMRNNDVYSYETDGVAAGLYTRVGQLRLGFTAAGNVPQMLRACTTSICRRCDSIQLLLLHPPGLWVGMPPARSLCRLYEHIS